MFARDLLQNTEVENMVSFAGARQRVEYYVQGKACGRSSPLN